jgi:RNA polymerase sigma factor (sigma-70 family)
MDRLLHRLKPMQRLVLEMAYVEDMPAQEIAEILGTTLASVKNSIHHAKRRVREIIKQE